jgi:hypothetical protein
MPGLVPACVDDGLKWKLQMCCPVSLAGTEAYIYTLSSAWRCRAAQMEFPAQAVDQTLYKDSAQKWLGISEQFASPLSAYCLYKFRQNIS